MPEEVSRIEPQICQEAQTCPFCGVKPTIEPYRGGSVRQRMIRCSNAACVIQPDVVGSTRSWAVRRWNRREHGSLDQRIAMIMRDAEMLRGVDAGSVEVSFSMSRERFVIVMLRARLVHRTRRGPIRVGGVGRSVADAFADLSQRVDAENERAAARDAKGTSVDA